MNKSEAELTHDVYKPRHVVQELLVHVECGLVGEPGVLRERLVGQVVRWVCLLSVPLAALLARLEALLNALLYFD